MEVSRNSYADITGIYFRIFHFYQDIQQFLSRNVEGKDRLGISQVSPDDLVVMGKVGRAVFTDCEFKFGGGLEYGLVHSGSSFFGVFHRISMGGLYMIWDWDAKLEKLPEYERGKFHTIF